MKIKEYLLGIRRSIDASPEIKVKIMWLLDKMPIVKDLLRNIGKVEKKSHIETFDDLSGSAKDIYLKLNQHEVESR